MKKSRYTEEQVAYALRLAESGTPVADACRQRGIAEATFHLWKKKSGALTRMLEEAAQPAPRCGAADERTYRRGVTLDFIRPGKPVENASIESFNVYSFVDVAHAQELLDTWRYDYNHQRPHGALGKVWTKRAAHCIAQPTWSEHSSAQSW